MKFIEVEDCLGNEALIDPFSLMAVEQITEDDKSYIVAYFHGFRMELNESYESLKHKLNEEWAQF